MATALVVVAGLLIIPAIDHHEVDARSLKEWQKKLNDRLQKAQDRINKALGNDHEFHS